MTGISVMFVKFLSMLQIQVLNVSSGGYASKYQSANHSIFWLASSMQTKDRSILLNSAKFEGYLTEPRFNYEVFKIKSRLLEYADYGGGLI